MEWEKQLKETFERIMADTPEMFRDVARKAVGNRAETNARERGARLINKDDLVKAFKSETPEVFQAQMLESLQREGLGLDH